MRKNLVDRILDFCQVATNLAGRMAYLYIQNTPEQQRIYQNRPQKTRRILKSVTNVSLHKKKHRNIPNSFLLRTMELNVEEQNKPQRISQNPKQQLRKICSEQLKVTKRKEIYIFIIFILLYYYCYCSLGRFICFFERNLKKTLF